MAGWGFDHDYMCGSSTASHIKSVSNMKAARATDAAARIMSSLDMNDGRDWWGDAREGRVSVADLLAYDPEYHVYSPQGGGQDVAKIRAACPNCEQDPMCTWYTKSLVIDPTYGRASSLDAAPWRCMVCGMHRKGFVSEGTQNRREFEASVADMGQWLVENFDSLDDYEKAVVMAFRNTVLHEKRRHTNDVPFSARCAAKFAVDYRKLFMSPQKTLQTITKLIEKGALVQTFEGTPGGVGIEAAARYTWVGVPIHSFRTKGGRPKTLAVDKETEDLEPHKAHLIISSSLTPPSERSTSTTTDIRTSECVATPHSRRPGSYESDSDTETRTSTHQGGAEFDTRPTSRPQSLGSSEKLAELATNLGDDPDPPRIPTAYIVAEQSPSGPRMWSLSDYDALRDGTDDEPISDAADGRRMTTMSDYYSLLAAAK